MDKLQRAGRDFLTRLLKTAELDREHRVGR